MDWDDLLPLSCIVPFHFVLFAHCCLFRWRKFPDSQTKIPLILDCNSEVGGQQKDTYSPWKTHVNWCWWEWWNRTLSCDEEVGARAAPRINTFKKGSAGKQGSVSEEEKDRCQTGDRSCKRQIKNQHVHLNFLWIVMIFSIWIVIVACFCFSWGCRLPPLRLESSYQHWTFPRFFSCEESLLDYLGSLSSSSLWVLLVWNLHLPSATLRSQHKEIKLLKVVAVSCLPLGTCWTRWGRGLCDHGGPTSHRFTHCHQ